MKKFISIPFIVSIPILIAMFSSCSLVNTDFDSDPDSYGDWIIDWAPVSVVLRVEDADGNDLLDPDNENNLIDGTSISFKGETFYASREWYEARLENGTETKAYLAILYGLRLVRNDMLWQNVPDGFCLYFGEIDGAEDMDEDIVVTWPDGSTNVIHYHCSDHNIKEISCDRSWRLDGTDADSNVFAIVK